MPERHYKLKCLGRDVTMIVDDEKGVAFDGYDERAERSLKALGKSGSSPCWIVAHAVVDGDLDKALDEQIEERQTETVAALIAAGANANTYDGANWALDNNAYDIFKILFDNGEQLQQSAHAFLFSAAYSRADLAVETLLSHLDPSNESHVKEVYDDLWYAMYQQYPEIEYLFVHWLKKNKKFNAASYLAHKRIYEKDD